MIVTITPNPSVDRTLEVEMLEVGGVSRANSVRVDAGGKGINISRALSASGVSTVAVFPVGGSVGAEMMRLLADEGVAVIPVPIGNAIRMNVSIVTPDGVVTKINEPGPVLSMEEEKALIAAAIHASAGASWVVASGTLPLGVGEDFFARALGGIDRSQVRFAIDTVGNPLLESLRIHPQVIKPNLQELAELCGAEIHTLGDAVDAAHQLIGRGARSVLASLGPDGAILVDGDSAVHGEAPVDQIRSTVGAGDSLLAGFLYGGGSGSAALAEALAWASAAVTLPGSRMPNTKIVDRSVVVIHDSIESGRKLKQGSQR